MFGKNFYPTPGPVIEHMLNGLDLQKKIVVEPQAGRGDLVDGIQARGATVLACEIEKDLAAIVQDKADQFLGYDSFDITADKISHVDFIIMNPPFDKALEHILYAWEIAPSGCQIISLCNYEILDSKYTKGRRQLQQLIRDNGNSENLGECFTQADRKTDVIVGMITLYKPRTGEDEFEGYFDMFEEHENQDQEGIMPYNSIKDIVNRYVEAVKRFDKTISVANELNDLMSPITTNGIKFGAKWSSSGRSNHYTEITRDIFKKELQKSAWEEVFKRLNMAKYVTSKVKETINKFVEQQTKVPFTMSNIYKMFEMIMGTRKSRMDGVVVEMFDWLTKYTHDNRFELEGWKTNSEYIVNKKFIAPHCGVSKGYHGEPEIYYSNERMNDLTKALCYITGTNYDDCWGIHEFFRRVTKTDYNHYKDGDGNVKCETTEIIIQETKEWGKWYKFNFFEIKVYKKGTMHCKFIDEKVWEKFNQVACQGKGFMLAAKYKPDMRAKKTDLMKV